MENLAKQLVNFVAGATSDKASQEAAYWIAKKGFRMPLCAPGTRFRELIEEKIAEAVLAYLLEEKIISTETEV